MKVREIKNGRLAMIAFLGFTGQYLATQKGPVDNLIDHLKVCLSLLGYLYPRLHCCPRLSRIQQCKGHTLLPAMP